MSLNTAKLTRKSNCYPTCFLRLFWKEGVRVSNGFVIWQTHPPTPSLNERRGVFGVSQKVLFPMNWNYLRTPITVNWLDLVLNWVNFPLNLLNRVLNWVHSPFCPVYFALNSVKPVFSSLHLVQNWVHLARNSFYFLFNPVKPVFSSLHWVLKWKGVLPKWVGVLPKW